MKINNRKNIRLMMYSFFFILFVDILCLALVEIFSTVHNYFLYLVFFAVFVITIWRILILKTLSIEISEHILSIKYSHPLSRTPDRPVLEVPLQKVRSGKIRKNIFSYFLIVNINTKRGIRSFYYRLSILSCKQIDDLRKALDSIISYRENETRL